MGKKLLTILFISMIAMGAFCGLILYWVIMFVSENIIMHCIIIGGIFGLLNSFIILFFLKMYTAVKFKNQRLDIEIRKDKLTGLYNRHAFDNDIRRLNPEAVYSMIFFDADNFRDYNNVYGHQVGDKILVDCANIIKSNIRDTDFAYRYGGEEIVVILTSCSKKEAGKIAQNIVENICNNDNILYPPMTISAGVASMPEDVQSFDQLIRASDLAMLQAKKNGKNQVTVYDDLKKDGNVGVTLKD